MDTAADTVFGCLEGKSIIIVGSGVEEEISFRIWRVVQGHRHFSNGKDDDHRDLRIQVVFMFERSMGHVSLEILLKERMGVEIFF